MQRRFLMFRLFLHTIWGGGNNKASIVRKSGLFKSYGKGGYYHPNWVPSHPELIEIGNNVTIAAGVRFFEHDVIHKMWMGNPLYCGPHIKYYTGGIKIEDNVVVGANSIILYNITIGHDAVVAAGSVVTKNVAPYSIVGGNPAQIIGSTKELLKKRLIYSGYNVETFQYEEYFSMIE